MVKISDMTSADVEYVKNLCVDASPWSEQSIKSELENSNATTLVAIKDGAVIGFINAHIICGEGAINNLAVQAEYRKCGIATQLITELFKRSQQQNVDFFTLEVRESNQRAIAFYQKIGFIRLGIRKNFYEHPTENAVIYKIDI